MRRGEDVSYTDGWNSGYQAAIEDVIDKLESKMNMLWDTDEARALVIESIMEDLENEF